MWSIDMEWAKQVMRQRATTTGESVVPASHGLYAMGGIREAETFRYTAREARQRMLGSGHYGPWESDL